MIWSSGGIAAKIAPPVRTASSARMSAPIAKATMILTLLHSHQWPMPAFIIPHR